MKEKEKWAEEFSGQENYVHGEMDHVDIKEAWIAGFDYAKQELFKRKRSYSVNIFDYVDFEDIIKAGETEI